MTYPNPYKAFCIIDAVYDSLFPKLPLMHSHGKAHVMEVVTILCALMQQENVVDPGVITFAIICAVFHEAWDTKISEGLQHRILTTDSVLQTVLGKYDFSTSLISDCKMDLYILVKMIVTRISWSRERAQNRDDWSLLPPLFLQIRHLVSDADKLAAMGPTGILRSMLYQKEYALEHQNKTLTDQEVKQKYWVNSWLERLQHYPNYIRTKAGKEEAERRMHLMHAYHCSMGCISG